MSDVPTADHDLNTRPQADYAGSAAVVCHDPGTVPVHLIVVAVASGIDDLRKMLVSIHRQCEQKTPETVDATSAIDDHAEAAPSAPASPAAGSRNAHPRLGRDIRVTVASNDAHEAIRTVVREAPGNDITPWVDWIEGGGRGYGHAINRAVTAIRSNPGLPAGETSFAGSGTTSESPETIITTTPERITAGAGAGGDRGRGLHAHEQQAAWYGVCNADLIFPAGSIAAMLSIIRELENTAGSQDAKLSDASSCRQIGAIAPRLVDPPDNPSDSEGGEVHTNSMRLQPSIGRFPTLFNLLFGKLKSRRDRKYVALDGNTTHPTPVDWATGACLIVRARAWQDVGGFDTGFFLDYEDVDLARRLQNAGWDLVWCPWWSVVHTGPNAQRRPRVERQVHTRASLIRYFALHRPRWEFHLLGILISAAALTAGWWHPMGRSWYAGARAWRRRCRSR